MPGCLRSANRLPRSALPFLIQILEEESIAWLETNTHLVLGFRDGADSWFIRTSQDETANAVNAASVCWSEFQRLDAARSAVLLGLRHHAAAHRIAVERTGTGLWGLHFTCGDSSIVVGPKLTRLVREGEPATALLKLLENHYLPQLTEQEAAELVTRPTPPPNEQSQQKEEDRQGLFGAKSAAFDCSALQNPETLPAEPEALTSRLLPTRHTPGQRVVEALEATLGAHRVSLELTKPGTIDFEFSDKLSSLRLVPQGKRLARSIAELGEEGTVHALCTEFARLDQERGRAIRLWCALVARDGLCLDENRLDATFYAGTNYRQFAFSFGRHLTNSLKSHDALAHVSRWLAQHPLPSPAPDDGELEGLATTTARPRRRSLPDHPPGRRLELPRYSELDVASLDERAIALIAHAREIAEHSPTERVWGHDSPLSRWLDPSWYRRGLDRWVDEPWWVARASDAWRRTQDQSAAIILLHNGVDEPHDYLQARFAEYPEWEAEAFLDELLWLQESELPWPIDVFEELPKYSPNLGATPDFLARRLAVRCREGIARALAEADPSEAWSHWIGAIGCLADLAPSSECPWLTEQEWGLLRTKTRTWAQQEEESHLVFENIPLLVAARHGWAEIVPLLEANTAFIHEWLGFAPELFPLGEHALRLSAIGPSELAARFAAHALLRNNKADLQRCLDGTSAVFNVPNTKRGRFGDIHTKRMDDSLLAAAIAWSRCSGRPSR